MTAQTAEAFTDGCRVVFGERFEVRAAEFFDVRVDTVRHWSTGRRVPPLDVIRKLRDRLVDKAGDTSGALLKIDTELQERGAW